MPQVELEDVRCYYELLGSGDPLLLIPGLGNTCATWDGIAEELADSFSLIMPDLRGIGRSEPKRQPRNLSYLVSDLVELLDRLQLERVHVLGLSLGGIVAQQLAVEHPSRVDRLVLVSCGHRFGPYLREIVLLLGKALRHFPRADYERMIEVLGTSPQFLDASPTTIELKLRRKQNACTSRKAIARQLRCLGLNDVGNGEYDIQAPTLIVAGDHDVLIPSCYAEQMACEISNSQLEVIPNCGHNPFTEQPDVVVPKIKQFLNAGRSGGLMFETAQNYQLPIEEFV